MGYRVIEEYLQEGREAAQSTARVSSEHNGTTVANLTSRMLRTTADLFEMWFQVLDVSGSRNGNGVAAAPARTREETPENPAPPPDTPGQAQARVTIRLTSSRVADVTVDLQPASQPRELTLHSLRSAQEGPPPISRVSITTTPRGALVDIRIPDDQQPGVYNGMIIDQASSLPAGTVSVRLHGQDDDA
jgi:hypothetical protein